MNVQAFRTETEKLGLQLSDEQVAAFVAFEDDLYRANEVMNLTRIPREEAWVRHFLDSLLFHDLIPEGASVLDIGTGPGFPSWPLACARPDLKVTALDSNGKMLGFLSQHLLGNLEVVKARAEEWDRREEFAVVTGRAVAPLAVQLEISAAFAKREGLVLPLRSASDQETAMAVPCSMFGLKWERNEVRSLPDGTMRVCPIFMKVKPTPAKYPRRWSEIKKG